MKKRGHAGFSLYFFIRFHYNGNHPSKGALFLPDSKNYRFAALKAAFPHTLPILAGFSFVGLSYGIYMSTQGFSFLYPMIMALVIYGGSLEFLTVTMLLSPFAPLSAFVIALMVQSRHIFYGLAMLKKFKEIGRKRVYLIFAMCDETFAINYTAKIPPGIDRGWFMFWVSALDQAYWVIGATVGGLIGSALPFDTTGIGFVMTTMFVVIFLSQLETEKKAGRSLLPGLVGFLASVLTLVFFGPDQFIVPAMFLMLITLLALRRRIEYQELREKRIRILAERQKAEVTDE